MKYKEYSANAKIIFCCWSGSFYFVTNGLLWIVMEKFCTLKQTFFLTENINQRSICWQSVSGMNIENLSFVSEIVRDQ